MNLPHSSPTQKEATADSDYAVEESQRAISELTLRNAPNPQALLELLWEAHAEKALHLLLSMVSNRSDADDALQNSFTKCAAHYQKLQRAKNIRAYFYQIVRNEGNNILRQRKKNKREQKLNEEVACFIDESASSLPSDEIKTLQTALSKLPEKQRSVLLLKIHDECTFQDISDMLGISTNTAASRYRYALEKMRTLMGNQK